MKSVTAALLGALLLSVPARAVDETSDAAKLFKLQYQAGALASAKASFAPTLAALAKQGVPPEGIKEVTTATDAFFEKVFNDPDLVQEHIKLLQASFSPDELKAILAFYDSPAGRKSLSVNTQLMQQSAAISRKYALKDQQQLDAQMTSILAKYIKKPAETPAKPADPATKPADPAGKPAGTH